MDQLSDISVSITPKMEARISPSAQLKALLQELHQMLYRLWHIGETNIIDIRSLPLMPSDYTQLRELLGSGEVKASISALGPTEIFETQIPAIWWVKHFNSDHAIVSEYIEVTTIPEILKTQPQDLELAYVELGARLASINH